MQFVYAFVPSDFCFGMIVPLLKHGDAVIAKVVGLHGVVSVSVAGGWNQT